MKALKIYLIVVSVLLVIAIGFGVYVWYVLQTIQLGQDTTVSEGEAAPREEVVEEVPSEIAPVEEPIVIDVTTLSDTQRSILEGFGYTQEKITVTPAMVTCAKEAVGESRFAEIINGSAPSPLESMKLLPCFKK